MAPGSRTNDGPSLGAARCPGNLRRIPWLNSMGEAAPEENHGSHKSPRIFAQHGWRRRSCYHCNDRGCHTATKRNRSGDGASRQEPSQGDGRFCRECSVLVWPPPSGLPSVLSPPSSGLPPVLSPQPSVLPPLVSAQPPLALLVVSWPSGVRVERVGNEQRLDRKPKKASPAKIRPCDQRHRTGNRQSYFARSSVPLASDLNGAIQPRP